ncbi:hypothetical protein [Streptomyces sp. WAC06614]|uniref:hypothetical protein n=1 Tax=Streptomyces sp. WAC06614 TaxID=2487416 RepID=UPI0011D179AC|nr:hypothetical protein [Streptomyces sp. WAC06614]
MGLAGISGWARTAHPVPEHDTRISVDAFGLVPQPGRHGNGNGSGDGDPARSRSEARSWGAFRIQHRWPPTDDGRPHLNWAIRGWTACGWTDPR